MLNYGREAGGVTEEDGYGPFALYVAVLERSASRTLRMRTGTESPTTEPSSDFRKQQISDFYYSMTAAAADFNHDGVLDVVSGPYIYYGPDYTKQKRNCAGRIDQPFHLFQLVVGGVRGGFYRRRLARCDQCDLSAGRAPACIST